MTKYTVYW